MPHQCDCFHNTSVLIEGLRSYWKYTFNITAAPSVGNSSFWSLNGTVRTYESAPGKVEHLHIDQIPGNFTSVKVLFACPNETERHGVIKYYLLSYEAQREYNHSVTENPQGLTISAEPKSNCNYSRIVPVTAQVDYMFSVRAFNKYNGTVSEKSYTTLSGESGPVASLDVLNTTAHSIIVRWTRPSLPNGNILGYLINVTSDNKPDRIINVTCDQPGVGRNHRCKAVDTSNTSSTAAVNHDGNKQYDYNITALQSYTDYRIVISCVNINGTGEERNTSVQTNMTVPSPPTGFRALVISWSNVTLAWTLAAHQDGPTTYYIRVQEATHLNLDTFEEKETVTVNGFNNTSFLIEDLRSYWKYTFSITAATPVGNSSVVCLNGTVRTNESAPGKVENLNIAQIPDNITSVEVFFSCPKETERHGDIKYYTLSYDAQREHNHYVTENPQGLNISAESKCHYSRVVPVTAQVDYMFSVQAFNKYNGTVSEKKYTTLTGESGPVASLDVLNTTAHSITVRWTKPSLPNGNILGYLINVTSGDKHDRVINVTCDKSTEDRKHECKAVDTSNTSSTAVVNHDGNKQYDYNITALQSYTDYIIVISCVNINGTGEERNTSVQTNMTVPSPPKGFRAFVNSSSSVTLFWTPTDHQDGTTTYYITIGEETSLSSHTFQEKEYVIVSGFQSTSVLVEGLRSYWNYNFSITAATPVGNSSVVSLNRTVRTDESVLAMPTQLSVTVLNASAVKVTWTPPVHKSGPTDYTILVQQATGRQSSTFENMENVTVNGYNSSERTIGGLLSSWSYKFSIIASTYKGGSRPMVSETYITTNESKPCVVQNLSVSSIPGNFTAVNLTWDCPNERERNGFIKNYTIQYSGPGAVPTVYGHYEPEDPCNATHTAILPVRPEHNYTFTVSANAMYKGKTKQSNMFPARAGKPLTKTSSEIFISTAAQSKDVATDTSFTVSFDSTTLLDDTNGKIIEAGILVMKKNEKTSKRPENMTDLDRWKNWYKWKNSGYKGSYRPTPEHYLIHARKRRSASTEKDFISYSVGVGANCDSKKDQFCNGPLEQDTIYKVVAVACTSAGCTSTEPFGNFRTEQLGADKNVTPWIAFGVSTAILLSVIIILVIYIKVVQPAKTLRSRGESHALNLTVRGKDGTGHREDTPYDEVACGSTSDNPNALANNYYENVDIRKQETYESLTTQINNHDKHLYDAVQARL